MRITVIGAGSFVFGPGLLRQIIVEHRLEGVDLALMDVDAEMVARMAAVGRRMADDLGARIRITAGTDRRAALADADYVVCCAAPQLLRRHQMDCAVIRELAPGHLISEFGGVAGIAYSLRQIAFIEGLCADMRELSPDAWLLTVSNPLPRVAQAAHECGVRTIGFCHAAMGAYGDVWRDLHGGDMPHPWTAARERYRLLMGGTNHCCYLLGIVERATGRDMLPEYRRRLATAGGSNPHHGRGIARCLECGYALFPGDGHTQDFLPPDRWSADLHEIAHGGPEERARRIRLLDDIAAGTAPWEDLVASTSWERPADFIAARETGREAAFDGLNLVNTCGQLAGLPSHVYVETPVIVRGTAIVPERIRLPARLLPELQRNAQVTDGIVRAARTRSRARLREVIDLDPTVIDKDACWRALERCLAVHAEVLPAYA